MAKKSSITVDNQIEDAEYCIAKFKFIKGTYPDVRLQGCTKFFVNKYPTFCSPTVNKEFTHLKFPTDYYGVSVSPYVELPFEYNGKSEIITVWAAPRVSRLARLYHHWDRGYGKSSKTLKFGKITVDFKNSRFNEKIASDCRDQIMDFIQKHPGVKIDDKYLEPKLKKLISLL